MQTWIRSSLMLGCFTFFNLKRDKFFFYSIRLAILLSLILVSGNVELTFWGTDEIDVNSLFVPCQVNLNNIARDGSC